MVLDFSQRLPTESGNHIKKNANEEVKGLVEKTFDSN